MDPKIPWKENDDDENEECNGCTLQPNLNLSLQEWQRILAIAEWWFSDWKTLSVGIDYMVDLEARKEKRRKVQVALL